jgi:hypothetical protein
MVPSGYLAKGKITSLAKTWNVPHREMQKKALVKEELYLAKILPAEYKSVDIIEVVQKQTHLTVGEWEQLQNNLLDF